MNILDLSCDVAGRFGAKLFALDGEEVLRCAPDLPGGESLAAYLDGDKQPVGPERLGQLVAECDLVWTSFDRGGWLGHASGLAIPDHCVHVTTSSFGTTGPYAGWRGGSIADWAAGGYLFITGDPDREPLTGPENMCAYAAGYTAALGAEAALIDHMRTGRGRRLDISVMETMLLLHQSTFSSAAGGMLRRRTGRYTEVYPLTVLPCRDGHVSIGVVTDAEFDKFAIAIDRPELAADPRFADREARWANRDALDRELCVWLEAHDAADIVARVQAGGVACAAVAGPLDITRNPQLLTREYWREAPGGGVMPGDPLAHFHPFEPAGGIAAPLGRPGELPLAGVRVLDFTIFWAGPSTTRALADLGADVTWVERPNARLDCMVAPGTSPSPVDLMMHLYDTKMFRGKRSVALDLEQPEDRAVAHALARQAHIVVENFRPGVADRLGIGPRELSRINPALTYVSLSGWGASGPWRDWRSYGPSIEAASSIEGRTGYAGGEPMRMGHAFPDATGGLAGGLATLRGLRRSLTTGAGGWYDISQLEAYLAMSGEGIIEATGKGRGRERVGNRSRLGALQGVFACKGEDQWIAIRLESEEECARFGALSGVAVSLDGDLDAIEPAIAAFTARHDKQALARLLQAEGLQAFAALDAHELTADPHLRERGYFLAVAAGTGTHPMPGTPLVATPRMADATAPAPRPGEHSERVRRELAATDQARRDERERTSAMANADDVLFVLGDQRLTRGEFAERALRAQAFLAARGIGQGDRIGIAFRNRPQFYELMTAATALGAASVPIAWRLKQEEVQYLVEDSGVKLVFFDPDSAARLEGLNGVSLEQYEEALATAAPAEPGGVPAGMMAFDLYSSGTTGRPKAIQREPIPPEILAKFSPGQNGLLDMLGVAGPGEVHLICGPLYHSQPIGFGATAIGAGHRVVMMEGGFDAEECLRAIESEKVTWLTCVPTHLVRIMALPEEIRANYDVGSVKAILHSAAPCPRDVKAAAMDYFPQGSIWEVYGGTEGAMSMISPAEWRAKPGSVGRAFPEGTQLTIMDEAGNVLPPGEVGLVYSRTFMKFRYKGASQLDAETWRGDYFTLGDMGYLDEDGYLFLTDRKKDMIISGGANIYPAEVENVLFNHPAVGDAAVIGVPDDHWGERVKAIVEPRDEVTGEDIIAFCREHLAHYKCPTTVDLVDRLPRDPSGKIRKRELREQYWQDAGRAI